MSGSCVLKIPRVYKLNNLTPQEHEAARPLSLVGVGLLPTGTGCVEQHIPLNRKRKEGKPPFRHKLGVQCYITIAIHNGENAEAERVNLPGHLQVFDNSDMIYRGISGVLVRVQLSAQRLCGSILRMPRTCWSVS